MSIIRVEGVDKVLKNLAKELKKIRFKSRKGLIKAGLLIQREAQKKVPVQFGNLKASAFTVWGRDTKVTKPAFKGDDSAKFASDHSSVVNTEKTGLSSSIINPQVEVGFSASYAIFVHEDLTARHKVGEAKFLENAVAENSSRIIQAVKEESQV